MKSLILSKLPAIGGFTAAMFALAPALSSAALIQTNVSNPDQQFYALAASSSDLINGLTATTASGWNLAFGGGPAQLNDGLHGANNPPVQGAFSTVGATVTYNLGLGSGFGYDLTSIQSIASWSNDGYGNQAYTVEIQLAGSGLFSPLASVSNTPFTTGTSTSGGATKTTLTDGTGVLVSGVEFIRFTATSAGASVGGATVFREIDVNGVASVPEPSSLGLLSLGALGLLRRRRSH